MPQGKIKLISSLTKEPRETGGEVRSPSPARPVIIAIGGGKGGVGKSLLTSTLGILLTQMDRSVLLVDADLGAANLHTLVGETRSPAPLSRLLKGEVVRIEEVTSKTNIPNLELVSGSRDSMDIANFDAKGAAALKTAIMSTGHDYVIMDLGPGTSNNMLDFFLMADHGVLVITPEPTSVENTYRFIKCLLLRRMRVIQETEDGGELRELLKKIVYDSGRTGTLTVSGLLEEIKKLDQHKGETLTKIMKGTDISIVINQARTEEDRFLGYSIARACADFFSLNVNILGHIPYSEDVIKSVRTRRPLAVAHKDSSATREIDSILRSLLGRTN